MRPQTSSEQVLGRLRSLPRPPFGVALAVVTSLVFALAYIGGRTTRGSGEQFARVRPLAAAGRPASVVGVLGKAAALPPAPKTRPRERTGKTTTVIRIKPPPPPRPLTPPRSATVPKVISGTG